MGPATQPNQITAPAKSPDKLQTEFVSVVSHELRTPVSAIQGYADLLLEGAYGQITTEQREIVQYVKESAGGLLGMINNLLSLSLMQRGQTDLVLRTFMVEEVIKDVLMTCRAEYEIKKLTVSYQIEPSDLCIRSDRIKLQQILTNLVTNAIRYTNCGWIKIEARTVPGQENSGPMFEVDVSDSGTGISQEDQERIFEQFYRGPDSTALDSRGMGLGLYIVRTLLRMLSGTINVRSALGKGSTFTVRLPVVIEEIRAVQNLVNFNQTAIEEHSPSSSLERIVLFLGEDPDKCRALGESLQADGIQVASARGMEELLECVKSLRPLAIILDPDSASRGGGEVLQALKLHPSTRTIPALFFMDATSRMGASRKTPGISSDSPGLQAGKSVVPPTRGTGKYRVLVVDDDSGMREALQIALESDGYDVRLAGDGREALQALSEQRPDLMLLDLMMPGLNGWEVIDILSQNPELRSTKVLMLTGASLSPEETQQLATRTGGLLRKDEFKLNNILAGVARAIGQN